MKKRTPLKVIAALALLAIPGPGALSPGAAQASDVTVYLTPGEAPRVLFPEATEIKIRRVKIEPAMREAIAARIAPIRPSLWERVIPTYIALKNGEAIGYAVVVNEIGKHRPITFVVGIEKSGEVRGAEIMVYREAVGGDVRMRRFLRQYEGKTLSEPIRTGRDITNISGATLSVRAVNRGMKKALALVELLYHVPAVASAAGTAPADARASASR